MITVEIDDDHEIFTSPSEFTSDVTREALRGFKSIEIEVTGDALASKVTWKWRRPWWAPGQGKDAEVVLEVRGPEQAGEEAFEAIRTTIKRGGTDGGWRQTLIAFVAIYGIASLVAVGTGFGLYLLKVSGGWILLGVLIVWLVGIFVGAVGGTWAYPSLEVAPGGQTNLRRTAKFVVPIVVTLVVTGIGKALYH